MKLRGVQSRSGRRATLVHDLEERFRRLSRSSDRQKRGYAFQDLAADLFQRCGFAVKPNPKGARPRQTDLYVKRHDF